MQDQERESHSNVATLLRRLGEFLTYDYFGKNFLEMLQILSW